MAAKKKKKKNQVIKAFVSDEKKNDVTIKNHHKGNKK